MFKKNIISKKNEICQTWATGGGLNMEGADCEAAAGGPRNCAPPPPAEGAYVPCGICAYCNFLNPSDFLNVFPAGGPKFKQFVIWFVQNFMYIYCSLFVKSFYFIHFI